MPTKKLSASEKKQQAQALHEATVTEKLNGLKKKGAFDHHAEPITRRDFLSHGLIEGAGLLMAPSLIGLLFNPERAFAADCALSGASQMPAVLIIDHSGGAGLMQQTLPKAASGALLTAGAYRNLGLPTGFDPLSGSGISNTSWGIEFNNRLSFVPELNRVALAEVKSRTTSFSTLAVLGDDTQNNRVSPAQGLAMLGALGDPDRRLAPVLGSRASFSGGNSSAAYQSMLFRSVKVDGTGASKEIASLGQLATQLGPRSPATARVMAAIRSMSMGQIERFSNQDISEQVKGLVDCGYLKTNDITLSPDFPSTDPASSAVITSVFDLTNGTENRAATLTYLLAQGLSGVATLELGGRDYHNNTRILGENLDAEAARITGKVLNAFHRMIKEGGARSRPLLVVHITDGGVSTDFNQPDANAQGLPAWVSDRGEANASYVFAYDPNGKPDLATNQLGVADAKSGATDRTGAVFSGNPIALAEVFLVNWLAMARRPLSDLSKLGTSTTLQGRDLQAVQVLARKG